jgi:hypothetical protein
MQSENTQSENKPHYFEAETTPPVLKNTHPHNITLNDNQNKAQTETPPFEDFLTPTLPCCQSNLSPTYQNTTLETMPTVENVNTTTPEITTIKPDKLINNMLLSHFQIHAYKIQIFI